MKLTDKMLASLSSLLASHDEGVRMEAVKFAFNYRTNLVALATTHSIQTNKEFANAVAEIIKEFSEFKCDAEDSLRVPAFRDEQMRRVLSEGVIDRRVPPKGGSGTAPPKQLYEAKEREADVLARAKQLFPPHEADEATIVEQAKK